MFLQSNIKGAASVEIVGVLLFFLLLSVWFCRFYTLANSREADLVMSQLTLEFNIDAVKADIRDHGDASQIPCLELADYDVNLPVVLFRTPVQGRLCAL